MNYLLGATPLSRASAGVDTPNDLTDLVKYLAMCVNGAKP
jgi:hypothetical protein